MVGLPGSNPVNADAELVSVDGDGNCFYYTIIKACEEYSRAYPRTWRVMQDRLAGFATTYNLPTPGVHASPSQSLSTEWRNLIAAHFQANLKMFTDANATDSQSEMADNYTHWTGDGSARTRAMKGRVHAQAREVLSDIERATGTFTDAQKAEGVPRKAAYAIANIRENMAYACGVEKDVVADLLNVMLFTYTHTRGVQATWKASVLTQINGPRADGRNEAMKAYSAGGFVPRFNLIFTDLGVFGHYQYHTMSVSVASDRAYLPHFNPKRYEVPAMGGANNPASAGDTRTRELRVDPGVDLAEVEVGGELYEQGAVEELLRQREVLEAADAAAAAEGRREALEAAKVATRLARKRRLSEAVELFKAHARHQIETVKEFMEVDGGRQVVIQSDVEFLSTIGRTGVQRDQFAAYFEEDSERSPESAQEGADGEYIREQFVDWLDEEFAQLGTQYPQRVKYGNLDDPDSQAPADRARWADTAFVWGADAANWNGEDGQAAPPPEGQAQPTSELLPFKVSIISTPINGLPPDPAAPSARSATPDSRKQPEGGKRQRLEAEEGGGGGGGGGITDPEAFSDDDEAAYYNYTSDHLLPPQIEFVQQKLKDAHSAFIKHNSNRLHYGKIALMNVADPNAVSVDSDDVDTAVVRKTRAMHAQYAKELQELQDWSGDPLSREIVEQWKSVDKDGRLGGQEKRTTFDHSAHGQAQLVVRNLVMRVFGGWLAAVAWWMNFKGDMKYDDKRQGVSGDFVLLNGLLTKSIVNKYTTYSVTSPRNVVVAHIVWEFMESARNTLQEKFGNTEFVRKYTKYGKGTYSSVSWSESLIAMLDGDHANAADARTRAPAGQAVSVQRRALLGAIDDAAALIAKMTADPAGLQDARWTAINATSEEENAERDVRAREVLERVWRPCLASWLEQAPEFTDGAELRANALLEAMHQIGYDNAAVQEFGALQKAVDDRSSRQVGAPTHSVALWKLLQAYDRAFSAVYGEGSEVDAFKEQFEADAMPAPPAASDPSAEPTATAINLADG